MNKILRILSVLRNRNFVTGFIGTFAFHILVSFVLFLLLYVVNYTSNACRVCDGIISGWNSIGMALNIFIGSFIPEDASFDFYRRMRILLVPIFLTTPVIFGLLGGYAYLVPEAFCKRFWRSFFRIYLPIWIITLIPVILLIGFNILLF